MAGTRAGGLKTAATNKRNDPDFYRKLGAKGGKKSTKGGFWYAKYVLGSNLAVEAGRKGGLKSRKKKEPQHSSWFERLRRMV